MKNYQLRTVYLAFLLCLSGLWVSNGVVAQSTTHKAGNTTISIVSFEEFHQALQKPSDSLTIVNFWATWCKPCVKELPYFEKVAQKYKNQKVRLWLVSCDFPSDFKKRLPDFVATKKLNGRVWALKETDSNVWINRINPNWAGEIPATLLVAADGKYIDFKASEFTEQSLEEWILEKIK